MATQASSEAVVMSRASYSVARCCAFAALFSAIQSDGRLTMFVTCTRQRRWLTFTPRRLAVSFDVVDRRGKAFLLWFYQCSRTRSLMFAVMSIPCVWASSRFIPGRSWMRSLC